MNWTSIAAMAALALTSASLVFIFRWGSYEALATVSVAAFAVVISAIAILIAIAKPCDRAGLLRHIIETMRKDFRQLRTLLFKTGR